jgi:hypothetical protein
VSGSSSGRAELAQTSWFCQTSSTSSSLPLLCLPCFPSFSRQRVRNNRQRRITRRTKSPGRRGFRDVCAGLRHHLGHLAKVGVAGSNPVVRSTESPSDLLISEYEPLNTCATREQSALFGVRSAREAAVRGMSSVRCERFDRLSRVSHQARQSNRHRSEWRAGEARSTVAVGWPGRNIPAR